MNFHLWCSSNSVMDNYIHLILFHRTLIGAIVKWYIDIPCNSFININSLAMDFLTHFHMPIWYETSTKLFTSLHKSSSTHIYDHIHECRWQRRLIKAPILDQLLLYWFTKSLMPPITKDVSMGGVVIE